MNNHTKEPAMPRLLPSISLLFFALSAPLQAETLAIPAPEQPATSEAPAAPAKGYSVTLPGRGMTMEQVEAKFGPPRERLPSVGDPPITRWVYDDFTVYFEYQYVIDAVPNIGMPKPAPAPETAPAETPAETAPEPAPAPPAPPGGD